MTFASSSLLKIEDSVLPKLASRFLNHNEELKNWLINRLVYSNSYDILESKECRNALTRDYVFSIMDELHNEHFESLTYEANRARGGMFVVEIYHNGTQESWLEKEQKSLSQFIKIKNKVLSYFEKNDDEDKPKKNYRTKF